MANYKTKITSFILLLISILSIGFALANENVKETDLDDYDAIYASINEADFDYMFGIDPHQTEDYTKYIYSPYPLFRSGVNLVFKTKTIPAGYYLLTPREKNGKTWILFKQNGKIAFVIPIYKEETVLEEFYEEKFPHPKPTFFQNLENKTMHFIGSKWGKKNQRTPIPKAYIEFNDVGNYWDMKLYYGMKKYYLIFKKD